MNPALVVLGAAVGAPLPYLTDRAVQRRHDPLFPWGTFTVNVIGSFILGAVVGAARAGAASPQVQLGLAVGFCGALTSYSTLSYETLRLTEDGAKFSAAANVVASIVAGLGAASGRQSASHSGHDNHQDRPVGDLRATPRCRTVIGRCMGGCRGWAATPPSNSVLQPCW